ncbi:MAG: hypothetical protein ISQ88_03465 [Rhodobacteraceae bacterium]|nr:hypothetical protein [Paracoccaceae bacterium]
MSFNPFKIILIFTVSVSLFGCSVINPSVPRNQDNACSILDEHRSWKRYLTRSKRQWGIPIEIQMAVIWKESNFQSRVKPPRKKILWIIPGKRPTSAKGYAQAVDGTWDLYKRNTGKRFVRRASFKHSTDFIGWYLNRAHEKLKIPKTDAYNLYLAYHEGISGYSRKSYKSKESLKSAANRVEQRASNYKKQLKTC